ncbi:hypothetical protein FA13DRAFT_1810684 [Coprinellus micaceus]|uniref:dual-specificity kinase n=1 Tax=Coprinellus micaceus TaxID=71717 RepID=A0A4Y7TR35_COPMI|nr:hypothetical protein FA13DRAFT_1810684 [Coprinellus micaceus]
MSAPPSPRIGHPSQHPPRKDRPAALDLPQDSERLAVSDGEVQHYRRRDVHHDPPPALPHQVNISVSLAEASTEPPREEEPSRSASASSSLDPYYFGIGSPSESPTHHMHHGTHHLSVTPDSHPFLTEPPHTPARNPASIDRRGLVGVGELTTPRWSKADTPYYEVSVEEAENYQTHLREAEDRPDPPDSPWTIEAIDGEGSDPEDQSIALEPPPRTLRTRPSLADESGGEEILYPRSVQHPPLPERPSASEDLTKSTRAIPPSDSAINSPPSSFSTARRARKRTSDEFELDQTGTLVSKRVSSSAIKDKTKDDLGSSSRKHRSLNMSTSATTSPREPRTRRRESVGLGIISPTSKTSAGKHSRQSSTGSGGVQVDSPAGRRVHTTDFSHLPPSPSSSSIQQILRQGTAHPSPVSAQKENPSGQASANVAHSLLRGTQEGWSGLDDEATAEALRKLDGLSGKTARSRASLASLGRGSNSSRPTTPSGKSGQWEGVGSASDSGKSKRGSTYLRGSKEASGNTSIMASETSFDSSFISSDDHGSYPEKTPKKQSRLSFTPKRGSTSSTTYASTPTTSSRESATTNATSISTTSGRQSSGKARRNSAGSDISNGHSSDPTLLKDRPAPVILKTPSKKWSFSSALNLKLSASPSSSSQKSSGFPLSPRSVSFGHGLRKSTSKDKHSASSSGTPWSPHPDAMTSANSLASISSVGSAHNQHSAKSHDKHMFSDRPDTGSSTTTSGLSANPTGALSPTTSKIVVSVYATSSKFQRGRHRAITASAATESPPIQKDGDPEQRHFDFCLDARLLSPEILCPQPWSPVLAQVQLEARQHGESEKEKAKSDKEKSKKDDKDRSESRISVLMGRKRGKTLSSTDARKPKSPVLPPMQMSAIEPVTAQRVAKLKSAGSTSSVSSRASTSSSRLTSHTVSSMQKQSDSSLRSRHQLPTIAGSPSVGTNGTNSAATVKERDHHQSALLNSVSGLPKETPTKIPRISSRTSAAGTPPLGKIDFDLAGQPKNQHECRCCRVGQPIAYFDERIWGHGQRRRRDSQGLEYRAPSSGLAIVDVSSSEAIDRCHRRDTSQDNSTSNPASSGEPQQSSIAQRFSALSPSKGLKLLGPKSSARTSVVGSSQNNRQAMGSPSSSRQSLSTPSPVPSNVDEDELQGDEEMMQYIRRQQAKKLAAGATQDELDELLKFPEPIPPKASMSPNAILKSSQAQALSEYERKEILDYPSVYCIGSQSWKKRATPDNPTNNFGYDDERGDYQVVVGDHLAYRYEVVGNLGKGSFGQVLNCRDHCTGESVAVKIIRNKKRFHHQALVEIKILDNLRKWDSEEKHHVAKMIEHFYFRNHLCIAMELLSINLYELIKANGFVGFTTNLIRRFTSQMLLSLSLMRHHRIVHCDLKPENVLLRHPAKSAIKVIDFGSSCFEHEKSKSLVLSSTAPYEANHSFQFIPTFQSRFYRSPEVILGMNYHMAIDMWSLGCILAELYTGFPIFPGENEQEQLSCIMEVLGVPDKDYINRSSRKKLFFDTNGAPRTVINSKGRRRRPGSKTLAQVLRCQDEEFIDFIAKCLTWEPERRMKPQAAMRHPFISAGKRNRVPTSKGSSLSSSISGSRSKNVTETPKKSMIGAPAPLSARTPRSAANGTQGTPGTGSHGSVTSSRSYRSYHSQTLGALGSGRGVNGYSTSGSAK